ncbi:MAG: galactonate dehydratase [Chitinophagaceae bacterium]|nr:galactonate dehydratase [Chitinophagaceae bacterium]
MHITDIKTIVVNGELRNWVFVKVETNEGIYGWGEATLEWKTRSLVATIEDLKPLLVGKDPRNITQNYEIMNKHGFWKMGIIGRTAISSIDIALWDILGKSLNTPVWQLLGGKTRDKVKMYTHLGMGDSGSVYNSLEVGPVVERAAELVEKGFEALKVVFIPYINYTASVPEIKKVERIMAALRDVVGDEIDIMIDFHGRPASASAALQFIKVLEPFYPLFVEEAIQPGEVKAMCSIKEKTNTPLASGERLVSLAEFQPYFTHRALDIAQPDLCHCGGFTEATRIASMAAVCGMGIAPHNPCGPIAGMAALHFDVATPNFVIQEKMDAVPWYYEVVEGHLSTKDGYCTIPDRPGLGIEVNEKAAAKYPYKQESVAVIQAATIADGTVVHW